MILFLILNLLGYLFVFYTGYRLGRRDEQKLFTCIGRPINLTPRRKRFGGRK